MLKEPSALIVDDIHYRTDPEQTKDTVFHSAYMTFLMLSWLLSNQD